MVASTEVSTTTGTLSVMSHLNNGIYMFTSKVASHAAADEYLSQIETLFRDNADVPLLRILVDSTVAAVSVNYVMPRYKDLENRYPNHPRVIMAVISNNGLIALMSGFSSALRLKQTTRMFKAGQIDAAIAWLLASK